MRIIRHSENKLFYSRYYGINDKWVDWTSMIYMILYIPLIFPGSWFLDKFVSIPSSFQQHRICLLWCEFASQGLRITALVGVFGTCIGSWIKVFSVSPDAFFIGFIGQSVVAFSQVKQTESYGINWNDFQNHMFFL